MKLQDATRLDPNHLPYFVTDSDGAKIPVAFAPLTRADKSELSGEDWAGALFLDVWRHHAESEEGRSVKLVRTGDPSPIIGLMQLGRVLGSESYLRKSLLETCPVFRYGLQTPSSLNGVGKVLVARLVLESYNQGASGAIFVLSHKNARRFYERIGFIRAPKVADGYHLPREAGETLFEKVTDYYGDANDNGEANLGDA